MCVYVSRIFTPILFHSQLVLISTVRYFVLMANITVDLVYDLCGILFNLV